ncbi:MAG: potassium-dependent mechanosensitive channel, partial [Candidatus Binatota bacterium]|nr:potassium-dependent mechanosensitive channel [Candidatus Binatota bacterium]
GRMTRAGAWPPRRFPTDSPGRTFIVKLFATVARSRRLGERRRGAAIALALLSLAFAPPAAAAKKPEPSLLEREPPGFDGETLVRVRDAVFSAPETMPAFLASAREQAATVGLSGTALVLLLLLAIAYALFGQRRFAAWFDPVLARVRARLPPSVPPWLSALAYVLAAGIPPLVLWFLYRGVARATGLRHPAFLILEPLLLAWAWFAPALTAVRELFLRPLLRVPREQGVQLYGIARWMLVYGILLAAILDGAATLGAPIDVLALLHSLLELSLIVLLAAVFARRAAVMALVPDFPAPLYRRFSAGFDRAYPLVWAVTVVTALLAWAGFRRLAHFVWIRTWALAGLFLGAVVVHHFLLIVLRRRIVERQPDREAAWQFYRSASHLLDYVGVIAVAVLALELVGVWGPLTRTLAAPVWMIGDRPLSLFILLQAIAIAAGFVFFARLLPDYLDFRVYPALSVDEGVAHAINTFLLYALSVAGILSALQVVGIGLAPLMLFAGALGIGVGLGLQTIANNLASGLTLIFSRALRKGDWVTVGDTLGVIQEVGVRATRLRTRDAVEYLVPNAEFNAGTIVNWTYSSSIVRIHVPVGVGYSCDPEEVRAILERVAAASPHVERAPAAEVWFVGLGESSLDFELLVWINVKQVSDRKVKSDLYFAIFAAFRDAAIEIPFPQRDVHIRSDVRTESDPAVPTRRGEGT